MAQHLSLQPTHLKQSLAIVEVRLSTLDVRIATNTQHGSAKVRGASQPSRHQQDHSGHGGHHNSSEAVHRCSVGTGGSCKEERDGGAERAGAETILLSTLPDGKHRGKRERSDKATKRKPSAPLVTGAKSDASASQRRHNQDDLPREQGCRREL